MPKGKFPKRFQKARCCICNAELEVVHVTRTLKCWDCRMVLMRDYQHKHNATEIYHQYKE